MNPQHLRTIERWHWLLGLVFCVATALRFSASVVFGLATGVVLAGVNLYALRKLGAAAILAPPKRRVLVVVLLCGKMLFFVALVGLVLYYLPINPLALVVGLSLFLLAIAIESIRTVLTN